MAMLKRKLIIKALLHEMPKYAVAVAKIGKTYDQAKLMYEIQKLYGQLGLYDHIIDRIKIGGIS